MRLQQIPYDAMKVDDIVVIYATGGPYGIVAKGRITKEPGRSNVLIELIEFMEKGDKIEFEIGQIVPILLKYIYIEIQQ